MAFGTQESFKLCGHSLPDAAAQLVDMQVHLSGESAASPDIWVDKVGLCLRV